MDGIQSRENLPVASVSAFGPGVVNHEGSGAESSISTVGVYERRAPGSTLSRRILVGLLAAGVVLILLIIGRVLF